MDYTELTCGKREIECVTMEIDSDYEALTFNLSEIKSDNTEIDSDYDALTCAAPKSMWCIAKYSSEREGPTWFLATIFSSLTNVFNRIDYFSRIMFKLAH